MLKRELVKEVQSAASNYHSEIVAFCQDLIRTKSVNGIDNEREIALLIRARVKKLGLPSELMFADPARPNIFVGREFAKKDGLLFVAHLDTVPEGDLKSWTYPPFAARIEKGELFGRGAIDCKAGIALSIYALKILSDMGRLELAKFAGVVDEESGASSKLGARYLLNKGLKAEAAIYTYPGVDTVTIGHRGLVRAWIKVGGEAAHTGSKSWQDKEKGANAIEALAAFINRLQRFSMQGDHEAFPGYKFVHTPTLVEGGSGESIVPDQARVLIDARLLPNQDNEEYIGRIKALASQFCSPKISFSLTVKNNIPGVAISPKEPIVQILKRLDKEVMKVNPEIRGAGPASEGYMFVKEGIPTICGFGAVGNNVHSPNEYLEIDSLSRVMEMYVRAAIELSKY